MRNAVEFLTGNHILNVSICAFFVAQVLKVILVLILHKKLDFRRIIGSGGMPSSHSATVCALAASVGKVEGLESPFFAIATITAIVVMYDASNVRRAAGEQAKILNYIMDHWDEKTPDFFTKELKELLGHTPFQVACGAAIGIAMGIFL